MAQKLSQLEQDEGIRPHGQNRPAESAQFVKWLQEANRSRRTPIGDIDVAVRTGAWRDEVRQMERRAARKRVGAR